MEAQKEDSIRNQRFRRWREVGYARGIVLKMWSRDSRRLPLNLNVILHRLSIPSFRRLTF